MVWEQEMNHQEYIRPAMHRLLDKVRHLGMEQVREMYHC